MENRSNPCSCCCSLVVLAGISVLIIRWDISVIRNWEEELEGADYVGQVWLLVTCMMITYLWFSIPITFLLIGCEFLLAAKYIGYSLLGLFGPNLLIWNIIGCVCDTIKYSSYCGRKSNCNAYALVIVLKVLTWFFLYFISVLLSYIVFRALYLYLSKIRHRQRILNWRKNTKAGKALLDSSCSICLEHFQPGESLNTLPNCSHSFHSECISLWMHDHSTCPICRENYS